MLPLFSNVINCCNLLEMLPLFGDVINCCDKSNHHNFVKVAVGLNCVLCNVAIVSLIAAINLTTAIFVKVALDLI